MVGQEEVVAYPGLFYYHKFMAIIIKTEKQIAGIRKSCKLAADCLRYIAPFIAEGVTTLELNDRIEKFIRANGAIPAPLGYGDPPFPKATCISINEVICHGVPNETKLKNGDILNIDVTTILDGYYGDTSTMYKVGDVSTEAEQLLDVAKKCLEVGIRQVKPKNRIGHIGQAIQRYALLQGCTVVYQFCGHGVGLYFHELPPVSHCEEADLGPYMKPGMTFTIEPMINLGVPDAVIDESDHWTARTMDGKLSAQYEHTVLVTKTGVEILTV